MTPEKAELSRFDVRAEALRLALKYPMDEPTGTSSNHDVLKPTQNPKTVLPRAARYVSFIQGFAPLQLAAMRALELALKYPGTHYETVSYSIKVRRDDREEEEIFANARLYFDFLLDPSKDTKVN